MKDKWFIIIDEMSFLSQAHFYACSESAREAASAVNGKSKNQPFGGCHMVLVGDFMQHEPTSGKALYRSVTVSDAPTAALHKTHLGALLYQRFDTVFVLRSQHRFDIGESSGAELLALARCFTDPTVQRHKIARLCDKINDRAITSIEPYTTSNPHVVILRHTAGVFINRQLLLRRAATTRQQVLYWLCHDKLSDANAQGTDVPRHPSSTRISTLLRNFPADKTGDLNTVQFFFKGMEYVFIDNNLPNLGRVRNKRCEGQALFLHPREPPIPPDAPLHQLHYPPQAIFVKPEGTKLGDIVGHPCPTDCIPVGSKKTTFTVTLPFKITIGDKKVTKVHVHRLGLPLGDAYAVTDYFCQGMSFKEDLWLSHLVPPAVGKFERASPYVIITRHASMDRFHGLTPLWHTTAERELVIDKFYQAARSIDPDLVREVARLDQMAVLTSRKLQESKQQVS